MVNTAPDGSAYTMNNLPKSTLPAGSTISNEAIAAQRGDYTYNTPFTVGDALQAAEVVSKFGNLGSPEVEKINADTTSITKNTYDVRPQLFQNQRNFSNLRNNLVSNSINTRRAMLSNAYSTKLNADSQVISQYQNMNNEANVQYEQRLADQRRYNIQQTNYTNDLNARNRGQHKTLLDNAWTSVGNFGEQLNNKVYANDVMALYQEMYPEIYKDSGKALNRNRALKLGRRNGK